MEDTLSRAWYVKYRPDKIEDYAGDEIKDIVNNRFTKKESRPHVVMISGDRGCGKTTLARILSKYYLCTNPKEDGSPCNECEACKEINESLINGQIGDITSSVTEVDATTVNGKDAIQSVMEEAMLEPMYSDVKIIIFDECHMITQAAQNSLLKLIEDIPKHLVVFFATTNPEKVLDTIKSRCQITIQVTKHTIPDIVNRLTYISKCEGLQVSEKALEVIAKKGDRVLRECINLLENVAKSSNGVVDLDSVRKYTDDIAEQVYVDFFEAANDSLEAILKFLNKLKDEDIKSGDFAKGLSNYVMDAMFIKHGMNLSDYSPDTIKSVSKLFKLYETPDFDLLMQIMEQFNRSIKGDDISNNFLAITLAAMRVGKIGLLSDGVSNEASKSREETNNGVKLHTELLGKSRAKLEEQVTMAMSQELIQEEFKEAKDVAVPDTIYSELQGISQRDLDIIPEDEEDNSDEYAETDEIDEFFSD